MRLPSPTPIKGEEFKNAELKACLQLDPRKASNYEKYLSYKRGEEVDFLPVRMDIETVSACNFRCLMCTVSDWENGKRHGSMNFENFKTLVDQQYGLVEVKLTGLGEPLIQGDQLFECIKYLRERRIWVRMVTNASLLHFNNNIAKLVKSDLNDLTISIDGGSKEVFESIRRGSNFERVASNCKKLNTEYEKEGKQITKAWCCVQEENIEELEAIVCLAAKCGFRQITFSISLHGWGRDDLLESNRKRTANNSETLDYKRIAKLIRSGAAQGIEVTFWNVSDKYDSKNSSTLCPWPFERVVITSDMRFVPCCMIGNPDTFEVNSDGFLSSKSFRDVWFGTEYKKFREQHSEGRIPDVCKSCYNSKSDF